MHVASINALDIIYIWGTVRKWILWVHRALVVGVLFESSQSNCRAWMFHVNGKCGDSAGKGRDSNNRSISPGGKEIIACSHPPVPCVPVQTSLSKMEMGSLDRVQRKFHAGWCRDAGLCTQRVPQTREWAACKKDDLEPNCCFQVSWGKRINLNLFGMTY